MNTPRAILFLILGLISTLRLSAETIQDIISKAGNTESEHGRHRMLEGLFKHPDLRPDLRSDPDRLLPIVDLWANGREKYWNPTETGRAAENGYLCNFITSNVHPDKDYPPRVSEHSPLYPIWCMYRGRMLIQRPIQSGGLHSNRNTRDRFYGEGHSLLQIASNAFPQNRIISMYLGHPISWPALNSHDPNSPAWANHQREALEKLADIIYFWIDNRQTPDGQFGGGWGDDVEMWRSWTPLLIGFDDPKINAAQTRISDGLFALSRMKGGFTSIMSDVEHTAEDSGDSGTAMMHVSPGDATWKARARHLAFLMKDLWTGRNDRGFLQFKSTYFISESVHPDPQKACDTVYHPRAVQPALLFWQRTGEQSLTKLFSAWMNAWVEATARSERGKPAGIIPSAIHWPDGTVGGLGKDCWDPRNHGETTLYLWPSAMSQMTANSR